MYLQPGSPYRANNDLGNSNTKDMLNKVMKRVESTNLGVKLMKSELFSMGELGDSHSPSIKKFEDQMGWLCMTLNHQKSGILPSDTI